MRSFYERDRIISLPRQALGSPMEIADRRVATVHFTMKDEQGNVLGSTQGHAPLVHVQGTGGIVPALEQALEGKKAGDRFEVEVPPELGFGPRQEGLVQTLPRSAFTGGSEPGPGDVLQAQTAGRERTYARVTAVDGEHISVDANHPFAGQTLHLDVEVVDVRLATPEEIQFGIRPTA
jgi:FKBP-type peptidyl-prolyl cis-trans isomerase SlyD